MHKPRDNVPQQGDTQSATAARRMQAFMTTFAAARAVGAQPSGATGDGTSDWDFKGGGQAARFNAWMLQSMYLDSVNDGMCQQEARGLCKMA